jgi:ssDNA-binding Zn-finger/Zn-ribbon topoisomerase 1
MSVRQANHTPMVVSHAQVGDNISIGGYELEIMSCPSCGVIYAMPARMAKSGRDRSDYDHYCPNGHQLSWKKGAAEKLQEKLDAAEAALASRTAQLDQTEASLRATKGQLTKARNKAARTQCPVDSCHRTFAATSMKRHIETKHPDYEAAGG